MSPASSVRKVREALGLSQKEFATRFGFKLSTLRQWEQGRRFPPTASATLLKVIERAPETVEAAVALR